MLPAQTKPSYNLFVEEVNRIYRKVKWNHHKTCSHIIFKPIDNSFSDLDHLGIRITHNVLHETEIRMHAKNGTCIDGVSETRIRSDRCQTHHDILKHHEGSITGTS